MNAKLDTVESPLMNELKTATRSLHDALDGLPYFDAVAATRLPMESYVGHLRALAVIHSTLEHDLGASGHPQVAAVWTDSMRKLPLLEQDLRFFEPRAVADLREASKIAQAIARNLKLKSAEQPIALIGTLYVLEGSRQGGDILAPQVRQNFVLHDEAGAAYLQSNGNAHKSEWRLFKQRMNALVLTAEERQHIVDAASSFFSAFRPLFDALYPVKPESLTYLATSLNPEAGQHPVPTDPREIAAALRAATRCWDCFPYFQHRYGERGRRYANSDGAWLVTLCAFNQNRIDQQIRWLVRVLATRGMPSIMLQTKLEFLVEELLAVVPEKKAEYERLAVAAYALQAARHRHINKERLESIARDFELAVGPNWSEKFKGSGTLLACSVADALAGIDGAISSLGNWMTDASRFPAQWTQAAEAAMRQAKQFAEGIPPANPERPTNFPPVTLS